MKCSLTNFHTLILTLVATSQSASFALSEKDLRGPIAPAVSGQAAQAHFTVTTPASPTNNGQMGGLSAPGADALMTPDMLLVTPTASGQQSPVPLGALVGNALKLNVLRSDVTFEKFRGILVSVTNGTNRPLVVNGDQATALLDGHTFKCATIAAIQQSIVAPRKTSTEFEELLTLALPAALSVGAVPTIRDIKESQRPVLERYGPDELRLQPGHWQLRFGRSGPQEGFSVGARVGVGAVYAPKTAESTLDFKEDASGVTYNGTVKHPTRVVVMVEPAKSPLVRQTNSYTLEATGSVAESSATAANAESNTPSVVGAYTINMNDLGVAKFAADGSIVTSSGARGTWELFDADTRTYVILINGQRMTLTFQPGRGFVDKNEVLVIAVKPKA
ncbi:unnamed protein product [Sphagnum jensenii]|uniref:Uncharacterized protein n=1 Tax=Sphagnum jensenii TaxID=128206 RepID=A0ABP0VEU7_9BRYO